MSLASGWQGKWAETLAVLLLLIGFITSLLLFNTVLIYLMVILAGLLSGRIIYTKRFREPLFPFILMIVGFLLGYILGNFWTSRFWTVIFFTLSLAVSYFLHLKKILIVYEREEFIK